MTFLQHIICIVHDSALKLSGKLCSSILHEILLSPNLCRRLLLDFWLLELVLNDKVAYLQDEISTGLDSSTTFQIVRSLRDLVQLGSATAMIALLQPAPEVFVSILTHLLF